MADQSAVRPVHLLLLPPPPQPAKLASIKAAYAPVLTAVLKSLDYRARKATPGSVLDVAIVCPHLYSVDTVARSTLYVSTQTLVANIYKLLCVIAAKEDINIEDAEGIDARVILVARPRKVKEDTTSSKPSSVDALGPVIELSALAQCKRPWKMVYGMESEEGEELLKSFLVAQDNHLNVQRLPGGIIQVETRASREPVTIAQEEAKKHISVAVGGTFDHLHVGHKLLMTMFAFILQQDSAQQEGGREYTIGITGDELLKNKKHSEVLESWHDRQLNLSAFMSAILDFRSPQDLEIDSKEIAESGPNGQAVHVKLGPHLILKYVKIEDPFGPTITVEDISALVISGETRAGGKAVNDKRQEKGWAKLEIFEVDVLDPTEEDEEETKEQETSSKEAFEAKISSTQIRQKLVERGQQRRQT